MRTAYRQFPTHNPRTVYAVYRFALALGWWSRWRMTAAQKRELLRQFHTFEGCPACAVEDVDYIADARLDHWLATHALQPWQGVAPK